MEVEGAPGACRPDEEAPASTLDVAAAVASRAFSTAAVTCARPFFRKFMATGPRAARREPAGALGERVPCPPCRER